MGHILNKDEVRELLYEEYISHKRILTPKEIEDKGIVSRNTLKRIYEKLDVDTIWQDISKYYECKIPTQLEQDKLDLIKRLQEVAKVEGEPVNSKLHRDLYCKGCRLFGSWRELCMSAGIKVDSMKTATLQNDTVRMNEMLEKIMIIACDNKKLNFKTTIQNYKNMPSYETIEKIYRYKWKDIVDILHLDLRDVNKYKYINNKEILTTICSKINDKKIKNLTRYSFFNSEIPFIYIVNKMAINWEWLNVLKKNNFCDCNSEKFKCTKNELLNVLAFKNICLKRHLSSTEINNDPFLPNSITLMKIFNKNIYEIWIEVENNPKYKLK